MADAGFHVFDLAFCPDGILAEAKQVVRQMLNGRPAWLQTRQAVANGCVDSGLCVHRAVAEADWARRANNAPNGRRRAWFYFNQTATGLLDAGRERDTETET